MRINAKSFQQGGRNSCGPTSVAQVAAQYQPTLLAEIIAEVYYTGELQSFGYKMSPYLQTLKFDNYGMLNMHLGALLVFATAVRDHRNQYLASLDPASVPRDGYDKIRVQPNFQPDGSSFFSTVSDVNFFYEMFGYVAKMYVGEENACAACKGTVDNFFPSDFAAAKAVLPTLIAGNSPNLSEYAWSIRLAEMFKSGKGQVSNIIGQYLSRLGEEGLKFACDNAGYASISINLGFENTPPNTLECNEQICIPEHWVQLSERDLTNDVCKYMSYGEMKSSSCMLLANFTVSAVAAFEKETSESASEEVMMLTQ